MAIKKKRVNKVDRKKFLEDTFRDKVGKKVFDEILDSDPTFNKQYAQWIFGQYLKTEDESKKSGEKNLFLEDIYKIKNDLKKFYKFNGRLDLQNRDINNLKDSKALYDIVKHISENEEAFQSNSEIVKETKKEITILLDSDNWMVLIPNTKKAAILYGAGTRWCTASDQYQHFENYNKQGPLYILIDKKKNPKDEGYKKFGKYQFHFPTEQYMDSEDVRINGGYEELLQKNRELLDVFCKVTDGGIGLRLKLLFALPVEENEKTIHLGGKKLSLSNIQCSELPPGLVIHGNVSFEKSTHIKTIRDITVYGNLELQGSSIESLEGKIHVDGKLDLCNCTNFRHISQDFLVSESFKMMNCSSLARIPRGTCNGMLYLTGSKKITEIPKDLHIKNNLYANGTGLPTGESKQLKKLYPNINGDILSKG